MLDNLFTLDGLFVIGPWFIAILIIVLGIIFKWLPKKWWLQPYIIGAVVAGSILLIYSSVSATLFTFSYFLEVILDKVSIVILILSFAYLAISLDSSGFFEYCAQKIVNKSRGNGNVLFVYLFFLVSILTFFTSNDIVILTMTPIVVYVGRKAGIRNMVPYLLSQFFAANILSMGLYLGSPTNIVIGDAVKWTFVDYFFWMLFPALISGITALVILYFTFTYLGKNRIQPRFQELIFQKNLSFSKSMKIKVFIFVSLLIMLSLTSLEQFKFDIWKVCAFFALVTIILDFFLLVREKKKIKPFFSNVNERMPWGIVPFVFSFFCLTAGLGKIGVPNFIGTKLLSYVEYLGGGNFFLETLFGSVIFGEVSAFSVNVMNDIPATVFFAEILTKLQNQLADKPALFKSILTGTLVGVNPGCNMTIIGALAGLMWIHILQKKKIHTEKLPTVRELTLYGLPIMILVIAAGCIAAWLQVIVVYY